MKRIIFCHFFKKKLEGMKTIPYTGDIGIKIYKNISENAWKMWMRQQTIIINEKKLNMLRKSHQNLLKKIMISFLFKK